MVDRPGADNPGLPKLIARLDDEKAKQLCEQLIILGRFPHYVVKDLVDTLVKKAPKITNPAAWLAVSIKKALPCRMFAAAGQCNRGDKCPYAHVEAP